VHGLDVEGLLAVPALGSAQVDVVEVVRAGHDLGELAGLEQGLLVHLVVLLGVGVSQKQTDASIPAVQKCVK